MERTLQMGLMRRPSFNILDELREAILPSSTLSSLSDRLASLNASERASVQQLASLIHKSSAFQFDSYERIAKRIYLRMDQNKLNLVVELLQELDPRETSDVKPNRETVNHRQYSEAYLDSLMKRLDPVSTQPAPSEKPQFDFDALIERVVSSMSDNKKTNKLDFSKRTSEGNFKQYAAEAGNSDDAFLDKLALSESSGDTQAEITVKDGRKFVGKYQFGAARLADYKVASKERFTMSDFKQDPALQERVVRWHIADIDEAIDALGDKASEYSRDGLRAVAHLGGKAGMKKFVKSNGEYNPKDELGSSLREYFRKFSP